MTAFGESFGRGALERIDRLLLVADREDGAGAQITGAVRRRKTPPSAGWYDAPLIGAGILRLVDEDMVYSLVELVEHPRPGILARQQPHGTRDQIVEVQEPASAVFNCS